MPSPRTPHLTLVEHRRAPRYQVDIPCEAITAQEDKVSGRVTDLSLTGLQIEGDTVFIRTLYPNFKRTNWRNPLTVLITMALPTSKHEQVEISLLCQLVYCHRTGSDAYRVGCQYLEVQPDVQDALINHIDHFGRLKHY